MLPVHSDDVHVVMLCYLREISCCYIMLMLDRCITFGYEYKYLNFTSLIFFQPCVLCADVSSQKNILCKLNSEENGNFFLHNVKMASVVIPFIHFFAAWDTSQSTLAVFIWCYLYFHYHANFLFISSKLFANFACSIMQMVYAGSILMMSASRQFCIHYHAIFAFILCHLQNICLICLCVMRTWCKIYVIWMMSDFAMSTWH